MVGDKYDIVIGDDCMGLYKNDKLVVKAVKLTFGDVLEACDISCNFHSADLDIYDTPEKLPARFDDVVMDGEEATI
jgi:hypothetical protein